jgi:glycosyltransferase involved in cell wall biosynthesis
MLLGYGVDLVVHKLSEGLSRSGHEVTVICSKSDETFQGGVYKIKTIRYKRGLNLAATEQEAYRVTKSSIERQDILVPCTFPYYYLAWKSGKAWTPIDFGLVPAEFYGRRIARELRYHRRTTYDGYFKSANRIISISQYLKQQLPPDLAERTEVVHPGIDHYPDLFLCDVRRLYELDGRVLLYFGRSQDFSPYKNVDGLIKAFRALKRRHADLDLVISTNCTPQEQYRLESQGAKVLNGVLMHFVPSIYNAADIYVTDTLWEGFDLPLLEASYFGLPVAANAIGAHPEIVKDGVTGLLAHNEQ